MNFALVVILLSFALIGFVGAGASLAVCRSRLLAEGELDFGMLGIAAMLLLFGGLCTSVAIGWLGIFAFGAVVVWTSYIAMASRVGLFDIEIRGSAERVTTSGGIAGSGQRT